MIYNEFHRKKLLDSVIFKNKFSGKKQEEKRVRTPKHGTLQAVKLGLLQSCYCSVTDDLVFVHWNSMVAHQQAMMSRTAAKTNNCTLMKTQPTKRIPFRGIYT
jgi:hypothetical protein